MFERINFIIFNVLVMIFFVTAINFHKSCNKSYKIIQLFDSLNAAASCKGKTNEIDSKIKSLTINI